MNSFFRRHKVTILWAVLGSFVIGSVLLFAFNRIFYRPGRPRGEAAEVVLVVDDVDINRAALDRAYTDLVDTYERLYRSLGLDFNEQLAGTDGIFRQRTLLTQAAEGLIQRVIVEKEARKLGISVPKAELERETERRYREYLSQLGVSEERFRKHLAARGITLERFKRDLMAQVKLELLEKKLKAYVVGPIDPTEDELREYYEKVKERYRTEPEKVKVAYLVVHGDEDLAKELLEKAKAEGVDLASLAQGHEAVEAGETDLFARGESDLPWDVEGKAFELKVGEVALVKDEATGDFYILKLLEKKEAVYKPFEEVKEELRDSYIKEKENEIWSSWLKEKRAQIPLETKDPVLRAFIAYSQGDTEKALEILLDAKKNLLDPDLDYLIGRFYEELYLEVGREKAELEKKESRTEEEEKRLKELEAKAEEYKKKAIEYYIAFSQEGEPDEALYQRILNLDPHNAYARVQLGNIYFSRELYIEAEREYDQALKADPNMVDAIVGQGNVAMAMELYDKAVERYRKALEIRPDDNRIKTKLAEALLKDGNTSEAKAILEEVLKEAPSYHRALKLMGDVLVAEGKPGEAIPYYEKAIERNPSWEYRLALGDAYKAAGDIDEAMEIYEEVKDRYPYRYEPYVRLAELHREMGDTDEALFWYREALKRTTDTLEKERIAKAIVELAPDDLKERFRLATYYQENYKYSAAIEQYQYILERDPENIDALLGIADSYAGKTEYDEALKYYRKALELAKEDDLKIEILTRIIENEKKRVSPKEELTQAAKEALWERALIYKKLGKTEKAKEDLQKIYEADPNFRADELIDLLKELGVEVEEQTPSQTISPPAGEQESKSGAQAQGGG